MRAQKPIDPVGDLAQRVAKKLARRGPGLEVQIIDDTTVEVRKQAAPSFARVSLHNLGSACRTAPATCEEEIDRFARALARLHLLPSEPRPTRGRIRAVLKHRAYVEHLKTQSLRSARAKRAGNALLHRPHLGDLVVVYVFDRPGAMGMLLRRDLRALSLDLNALHALALKNLRAAHRPLVSRKLGQGVHQIDNGDAYTAALLLLPDLWRPLAKKVPGDLVLAAPARHLVVFTGSGDRAGLGALRKLARRLHAQERYPLSPRLLRLRSDGKAFVIKSDGEGEPR